MVRSAVAATLVGAAAADYQCPGGPWVTHAGLRMTSTAAASCDTVKAEMRARVAGENGWYDQHNRGTYTEQDYGGDISFSRLTGDGKYTDKMTFVFTDQSGSCKIEGCSEAQVFSIADFSTNYCEQKLLYCGSDEGCNVANSDFTHTEDEKNTMAGSTTNFKDCLKVAEKLAEPRQYAKGFVRMPRNAVVPVATITDEMRAAAPDRLDWTETAGAVSPVKDQAQCGSCWAFSATEGVESGVFMTTGVVSPALSPQQIVSCDRTDGGCNGGDLPTAFDYVEGAGGLDTEDNYPYTSYSGRSGRCSKSVSPVVEVTDYQYAVAPCEGGSCSGVDEMGMKAALAAYGPLSVCVNANDWSPYTGGVFKTSCSGGYYDLDHCVQLVGYDTTASTPYWKVRNSWGTEWGEGGFIRLPMGVNACGIADEAMYVRANLKSTVV